MIIKRIPKSKLWKDVPPPPPPVSSAAYRVNSVFLWLNAVGQTCRIPTGCPVSCPLYCMPLSCSCSFSCKILPPLSQQNYPTSLETFCFKRQDIPSQKPFPQLSKNIFFKKEMKPCISRAVSFLQGLGFEFYIGSC